MVAALAAVACAIAVPAAAQVVAGESETPDVQVDMSVLDRLGPQPSLPAMLEGRPQAAHAAPHAHAKGGVAYRPYGSKRSTAQGVAQDGVVYHPYGARQGKAPAAHGAPHKVAKHVSKKSAAQPAVAGSEEKPAAKPTPAAVASAAAPASPPPKPSLPDTPAAPDKAVPKVSLPQTPAPVTPPAPAAASGSGLAVVAPSAASGPTMIVGTPDSASTPAPAAAPAATPAPAAVAPPPAQTASLPAASLPAKTKDAASAGGKDTVTVVFDGDSTMVPQSSMPELASLARRMEKDDSLTLQLLSYAQGEGENFGKARRVSLSRAVEVRKILMDYGVRSTRIDLRALGTKTEGGGPADRVDAVLVSR